MNPEECCHCSDKYLREHTPQPEDLIYTRRQFLLRTGMGFGALSLASIFGINPFQQAEASMATGGVPSLLSA